MNDEFPKDPRVLAATRAFNLGHSAIDIKANLIRIGCDDLQASAAIEQAIVGIEERKAAAKKATRTWGLWVLLFGCVILALAIYASAGGEVQSGRTGRLVLGYVLGGGASVVGIWLLIKGS
ncbi:hypothetical protein [Agrobacterium sp. RS6]|uniref:hypothetical protein n=1 Tax=Agrobacterium sp. RS6 TaxID=2489001 RepID=UPI000FDE8551|nr:hypothetical protein [Agrobacterium sp. RS6]